MPMTQKKIETEALNLDIQARAELAGKLLKSLDEPSVPEIEQLWLEEAERRLNEYRAGKVPFPSLRLNANTIIDLFPKKMWRKSARAGGGHENLNHFCIVLNKEAWQELLELLQANSVSIEDGPVQRWGAHGTGTSVYFRDPEGNLIEAKYY